jgi:hypothetical protein
MVSGLRANRDPAPVNGIEIKQLAQRVAGIWRVRQIFSYTACHNGVPKKGWRHKRLQEKKRLEIGTFF